MSGPEIGGDVDLSMLVTAVSGRRTEIGFLLRGPDVQMWNEGSGCATFGRDVLRGWLADPLGSLLVDGSGFLLDGRGDSGGRVAVCLGYVGRYPVGRFLLAQFRVWL